MTPENVLPWIITIATFFWAYRRNLIHSARQAEKKRVDRHSISLLFSTELLALLQKEARQIFATTPATRLLLLYAINGKRDFKYITCVFESNRPETPAPVVSAISKFVDLAIDPDYRTMLKQAELGGDYHHITSIETGLMSQIYRSEGISSAAVSFVTRCHIDDENDLVLFTAVESPSVLTEFERLNIRMAIDPIRVAAQKIHVQPD